MIRRPASGSGVWRVWLVEEEQILGLVQAVLGAVTPRAVRMTDGQQSEVWEVALPEHLMVRIHPDPRHFADTRHNLDVLTGLGLPVPRVLAAGLTRTRPPRAYLILTAIPGRDLRHELSSMTEPQMTRLAERIASFQTTVGTLPSGTGYGYVGIGGRGAHGSWWDVLGGVPDAPLRAESGGAAVRGLWVRVRRLVAAHEPYLRSVPPMCFLDDITVKNVLVQGGELQGLVDFDCVCYGDPLYWLGLTAVGVVSDVGLRELFYVRELRRFLSLTDEQRLVSLLYAAWIALGFVERFATGETQEWSARMLGSIEDWVAELESGGIPLHGDAGGWKHGNR